MQRVVSCATLHQLVDWIARIESCILIDGVVKPRKVSTEGKRTLVSEIEGTRMEEVEDILSANSRRNCCRMGRTLKRTSFSNRVENAGILDDRDSFGDSFGDIAIEMMMLR
jgi:hypothetical protein